ncbi:putative peptidase (DUF1758) domain-containing protein [Phthorimaea operculella]|nr:putative peptidase (DUF1758) domain-containing protein [Phthorimaea operculella]
MADLSNDLVLLLEYAKKVDKLCTNTKKTSKAKITRGLLDTRLETLNTYWDNYKNHYEHMITTYSMDVLKSSGLKTEENYEETEDSFMELLAWIKDHVYEFQRAEAEREKAKPEANYDDAWSKLKDRFDNKRVIVNNILSRLMNQKKVTTESSKHIKELLDTTNQCLTSLKNLDINTSTWDAIIVYIIVNKLDLESVKLWEQSLGKSTTVPTFTKLSSFLENRFRSIEMVSASHTKETTQPKVKEFHKRDFTRNPQQQSPKVLKSFATEIETTCTYCSQNHYICHCKDFASIDTSQRQDFVKKNNICFNCLVKGHSVNHCRQSTTCKKCGRRHHTLLHYVSSPKPENPKEDSEDTTENTKACNLSISLKSETEDFSEADMLATARIDVEAKNNELFTLRAVVDPGSQASLISESVVQLLNLDRIPVTAKISGVSQAMVTTKSMVKFTIHPKHGEPFQVKAHVLKKITSLLPYREYPQDSWPHSLQLDLADPNFHKPGSIDVLLSASVYARIVLEGIHKHNDDQLVAVNSQLGWLISGNPGTQTDSQPHTLIVAHTMIEVDQSLRRFWEMEENIPVKRPMNDLEKQCQLTGIEPEPQTPEECSTH